MQATALLPPMQAPTGGQNQTIGHVQHDPLRASVSHLLSRAYNLPCSTAAQAFVSLVQPTARFQLALDALLPLLDSSRAEVSDISIPIITVPEVYHTAHFSMSC